MSSIYPRKPFTRAERVLRAFSPLVPYLLAILTLVAVGYRFWLDRNTTGLGLLVLVALPGVLYLLLGLSSSLSRSLAWLVPAGTESALPGEKEAEYGCEQVQAWFEAHPKYRKYLQALEIADRPLFQAEFDYLRAHAQARLCFGSSDVLAEPRA